MEPIITPLDESDHPKHYGILASVIISYALLAGAAAGGIFYFVKQRDDLKAKVGDLKNQLDNKTATISGESGKLILGDLVVKNTAEIDDKLEVNGTADIDGKVKVGNSLVLRRKTNADDYLLQWKTGEEASFSLGASLNISSERDGLNLYVGSGQNDPIFTTGSNGQVLFRNSVNSATAFVIQNAAKGELFRVDSTNTKVISLVAFETKSLVVGSGSIISKVLFGSCAIDPPGVGAVDKVVVNCTATGVSAGDRVFLTPPSDLNADLRWELVGANAANNIQIRFRNDTVGPIDDISRNWGWFALR